MPTLHNAWTSRWHFAVTICGNPMWRFSRVSNLWPAGFSTLLRLKQSFHTVLAFYSYYLLVFARRGEGGRGRETACCLIVSRPLARSLFGVFQGRSSQTPLILLLLFPACLCCVGGERGREREILLATLATGQRALRISDIHCWTGEVFASARCLSSLEMPKEKQNGASIYVYLSEKDPPSSAQHAYLIDCPYEHRQRAPDGRRALL